MAFERWPTATGGTYNTQCTSSSSANTKGTYAQVTAATNAATSDWFTLVQVTAASEGSLLDVSTGAAASEVVQVPNIWALNNNAASVMIAFNPVPSTSDIAASTRIAIRSQSTGTSKTVNAMVFLNDNGVSGLAAPIAIGVSTAASTATAVDPGGTANTKGSYAQLVASLASTIGRISVLGNVNTTTGNYVFAGWGVDISTGGSGSEVVLLPDLGFQTDNIVNVMQPTVQTITAAITSGTRVAARSQCSSNTSPGRIINVAAIGSSVAAASSGGYGAAIFG